MIKIILSLVVLLQIVVFAESKGCVVSDILLKTIKITENETSYPYFIRTNESSTIRKFYSIVGKYEHKKTKDNMLIDCINAENCKNISNDLINSNITNLDLGLFQINYNSFKYPIRSYFENEASYNNACEIIQKKVKMNKGKWSWEVLASYHSMTPKFNKIYKEKLIENYLKLTKSEIPQNSYYQTNTQKEVENTLVMY